MQEAPFYSFRIEEHVRADHLRRSLDRFIDPTGIRQHMKHTRYTVPIVIPLV